MSIDKNTIRTGEPANDNGSPELPLHTIKQVCGLLQLGRTKVHELIKSRQLRTIHIGRATRVANDSLLEFIAQRSVREEPDNVG